jgi:U3 small nucleolar RNA-associated protein 11
MSGAATMRNAVKRVTHKERAQPSNRKKFGLLEKHKDYIERATDYKAKQNHLTKLRKKALDRNPDEFYFKMQTSQVRNGVHYTNNDKNAKLDNSEISLLKTQDLGYITSKKAVDDSKIRRLKENLHLIGEQRPKSHKVFAGSEEQLDSFDAAEYFDTAPELVNRTFNRPKLVALKVSESVGFTVGAAAGEEEEEEGEGGLAAVRTIDPRSVATSLSAGSGYSTKGDKAHTVEKAAKVPAAYKELRERVKRSKKLKGAMEALSLQRNLSNSKGTKRKLVVNAAAAAAASSSATSEVLKNGKGNSDKEVVVYKWKKQRAK